MVKQLGPRLRQSTSFVQTECSLPAKVWTPLRSSRPVYCSQLPLDLGEEFLGCPGWPGYLSGWEIRNFHHTGFSVTRKTWGPLGPQMFLSKCRGHTLARETKHPASEWQAFYSPGSGRPYTLPKSLKWAAHLGSTWSYGNSRRIIFPMPPCVWYCPEEQNRECTLMMRLSPYLGVSEGPNNNLTRKLNDKVNNKKKRREMCGPHVTWGHTCGFSRGSPLRNSDNTVLL